MSVYLGEKLISGTSSKAVNFDRIGQIISSTLPLTDAGLHLLDGSLIQGIGSYNAFVDYIAGLTSDYPDLFDTEANWQQTVTNYGVCGKFVYDSINNTVRLPKITGFIEGATDVTALGDLVQAGLPNITGSVNRGSSSIGVYVAGTGALTVSDVGANYLQGSSASQNDVYKTFSINASRSSSIYGNSTTVQPQSVKVLYYIVIVQPESIDINAANTSLSNLTAEGEKHFLNKTQVTNCILEAPSNWMTYSGSQVTIKAGTKYLVPNGRNADGTLNNAEVTLQSDVVFINTGQYDGTICIVGLADGTLWSWGSVTSMGYYRNSSEFPVPATGFYWLAFSEEDNSWYITADGAAYTQSNVCPLGTAKITSDSSILSINPFKPAHILTIGNREEISGWGMPSYTYIDLTLGASGATYQAPANGWYTICSNSNGTYPKNIELINSSGGDVNTSVTAYNTNNSGWLRCSLPVKKGDIVACYYNNMSVQHFRFVYAQGSGSEV